MASAGGAYHKQSRSVTWGPTAVHEKGELPGKMPPMLKTGRGAPAGLLSYQGTGFPGFFRGLLIYPDVHRRLVRAYVVERAGSTFAPG